MTEHYYPCEAHLTKAPCVCRNAGMYYVNVYELDRHYGGSEEGGWWYDSGELVLCLAIEDRDHAEAIAEMMREVYPNGHNRSSVIYYRKPRDYSVEVDDQPGMSEWSDWQPYE